MRSIRILTFTFLSTFLILAAAGSAWSQCTEVTHFQFTDNTGDSYAIVIQEGSTECDLQLCDEIGVFDGDLCVGASVFDGTYPVAIVAWADDSQTPEVDGYVVGNTMTFRVWRDDEAVEELADPHITTGNGNFGNGAFAALWLECVCDDDTEPPIIDICPDSVTIDCAASTDPASTGTPTVSDYCDPAPAVTYEDGPTVDFSFLRTWIVTDAAGNADTCFQRITLVDNTKPTIDVCPPATTADCAGTADTLETGVPIVSDNCDTDPVVTFVDGPIVEDIFTRTWTVTDASDNFATCDQIITFIDTIAPEITACPPDTTIDCSISIDPSETGEPTVTDNCDLTPVVTWTDSPVVGFSFTRTWIVNDASLNSDTCYQVITIEDTEDPEITCPADTSVQCIGDVPIPDINLPIVSDNCDTLPVVTHIGDVSDGLSCPETITRTYRVTDEHGNFAECSQTITVQDTETPQFVEPCPTDLTVECNAVPVAAVLTATDNCDLSVSVVFDADTVAGSCANNYVITHTWTATDVCGNEAVCTQVVTVEDTQAPIFDQALPGNEIVECDAVPIAATLTASDLCDPASVVVFTADTVSGACEHNFVITRTWTATDICGNEAVHTQEIMVQDTEIPVFNEPCPDDVTAECDNVPSPVTLTANDNCDDSPTVTMVEDTTAGSNQNDFIITRTWTATDACGNAAVCEQEITVSDTEAPTIDDCPNDIAINCDIFPGPDVTGTPTVSDNCDPDPSVTYFDGTVEDWSFVRTWTVKDLSGNSATCQQEITLVDTVKPQITCPPQVSVQCIDDIPDPNISHVSVLDNCDPSPTIEHVRDDSDFQNCPLTITRIYKATDNRGNFAECTQTIIVDDTQAPVFNESCPANVTVECDDVPTSVTLTASDNCDSSPAVEFSETTTPGSCDHRYTITRTWTATDDCDNEATCTQVVTVRDTQPPEFDQSCPSDLTVECDNVPNPVTLTAHDNCDGSPTVTFVEDTSPGSSDNDYVITRTWTATDDCGNTAECEQVITVEDTTPPTLTCPLTAMVECANQVDPSVTGEPTVTDNCDPSPELVFSDSILGKTITRTWVATDASGNADTCEQTIEADETVPAAIDTLFVTTEYSCIGEQYCIFWDPVSGATGGYEVKENDGFWEDIGQTVQKCFTKMEAATFSYRVRARNDCGPAEASMSRVVVVSGQPSKPDTLYSTVDTFVIGQQYTISWDAVGGATEYTLLENGVEVYAGAHTEATIIRLVAIDYYYQLAVCTNCGCSDTSDVLLVTAPVPTDVEEIDSAELPTSFALGQNYPNPFNPETKIEFNLPYSAAVRIDIYNVLGELVKTLVSERLPAGRMVVTWDGRNSSGSSAPSGVYLYRMTAGEFVDTRKMILLK